jgi:hypothetical protein
LTDIRLLQLPTTVVPAVEDIYLSIVNIVFYLTFVLAVEEIYLSIVNIVFYLTIVPAVEDIYDIFLLQLEQMLGRKLC